MGDGRTRRVRIGIDIGGTFTDIVVVRGGAVAAIHKTPSTPADYSIAIASGLGALVAQRAFAPGEVEAVVHGTTVATNAILEGRGARTALITTRGFRDVLELRRIRIPELYNFRYEKPAPLVARRHRLEVRERVAADGSVLEPLDESELDAALDAVAADRIEALAICFLNSYANPEHERRATEWARRALPSLYVSASFEILPEIREYERTSTTVVNAYVGPVVRAYLERIAHVLRELGIAAPLRVMQSNGGTLGLDGVLRVPAAIVESGPAAGVVAGALVARALPSQNAITIDMGGTTAKAALIEEGRLSKTTEYEVGGGINVSSQLVKGRGHALRMPVIDVSEIGAGGGSLAVADPSGRLLVGPRSAGSVPGPVAYGRGGTTVTLTDALVTLGYVSGSGLAGGSVPMDGAAAAAAVKAQIADRVGMATREAAHGIYLVAASVMTRAVKAVTTFRGRDPRDCALIAFGGNGALLAPQIAEELQIDAIVVPPIPGLFSACGLVVAPAERELVRTMFRRLADIPGAELRRVLAELTRVATEELVRDGCDPAAVTTEAMAEIRYAGQAYELGVPVGPATDEALGAALARRFHAEHERTFGHAAPDEPVDLVNLRVTALSTDGPTELPAYRYEDKETGRPVSRAVYFGPGAGTLPTPIVSRAAVGEADRPGPFILEEYDATIVVPPGWAARRDESGSLHMRRLRA